MSKVLPWRRQRAARERVHARALGTMVVRTAFGEWPVGKLARDDEITRDARLLNRLRAEVENVKHARRWGDEAWEAEATAKLDMTWAALVRERRQDS